MKTINGWQNLVFIALMAFLVLCVACLAGIVLGHVLTMIFFPRSF